MPGGSFWREEEGEAGLVTGGVSQAGVGVEEGAVGPVSRKRRQEEKDKTATQVCNVSADVFLRHTAVILM